MKIITIAMQKGGVGKSTLTRSLAVAASKVGHNVLVLDMDAQQSISQWAERRNEQLPVVKFSSEIELPKMLERAKRAGCDLVIIDTPPARSTAAPAAIEEADLVIVPCTPDIEAYEQLPRTARVARTTGKPAAVVLTMVHPNNQREEKIAREVFAAIGIPMAEAIFHRFKVASRRQPGRSHGAGNRTRQQGSEGNTDLMGLGLCKIADWHKCKCARNSEALVMAKSKVTAESFLEKMDISDPEVTTPAGTPAETPLAKPGPGRAGLKHIGGYFNKETTEQVAILRARLDLNNSQLLKRAIEELYSREIAARKFGDR